MSEYGAGTYVIVALIVGAIAYIYLLNALRKERDRFNALLNPDGQHGFVLKRSLMDSAREHERESKRVRSHLSREVRELTEQSTHAPQWPAGRAIPSDR